MSKYHARPTTIDGIRFASKAEAARYTDLKLMQRNGDITDLELQPKFPIMVNNQKVCTYIADFRYIENGAIVVEDVKGVKTPIFKLKSKLMQACYGIELRLTS